MEDVGITSTPISRFVNFKQFYFDMLPHLKELEKQNLVTSLLAARTIKKVRPPEPTMARSHSYSLYSRGCLQIIKKCTLKSVELPDIVSYFTDTSKAAITQKFIHKTQFIIGSDLFLLQRLMFLPILRTTRHDTHMARNSTHAHRTRSAQYDGHCGARHAAAVQLYRRNELPLGAQQGGTRRLVHRLHLIYFL